MYEPNHPLLDEPASQSCTTCSSVPPAARPTVIIGFLVTLRAPFVTLLLARVISFRTTTRLTNVLGSVARTRPIPNEVNFPDCRPAGVFSSTVHRVCSRAARTVLAMATLFFFLCTFGHLSGAKIRHMPGTWSCGRVLSFNSALRCPQVSLTKHAAIFN